ncbi:mobile element protein [Vibrio variabilis]|uniref:Mobile element protein n=1 Tax=Vibrio variabilis TaxID=990271 RepID=A0ABQ0JSB7_9VIBR|nr:mobile element protein [Vibrio variabilis]
MTKTEIQGFESLRMLNKGQFDFWLRHDAQRFDHSLSLTNLSVIVSPA